MFSPAFSHPAHSSSQAGTAKAAQASGAEEVSALRNGSKPGTETGDAESAPCYICPSLAGSLGQSITAVLAEGGCDGEGV